MNKKKIEQKVGQEMGQKKRTHCTKVRHKAYPICRRFTFEFGTAQRCTVTEIAPPKSLLCVNRKPIQLVCYTAVFSVVTQRASVA